MSSELHSGRGPKYGTVRSAGRHPILTRVTRAEAKEAYNRSASTTFQDHDCAEHTRCSDWLANTLPRSSGVSPWDEIWMEQVGEQFHSLYDSWPRPSEVRVSIYSVDLRA